MDSDLFRTSESIVLAFAPAPVASSRLHRGDTLFHNHTQKEDDPHMHESKGQDGRRQRGTRSPKAPTCDETLIRRVVLTRYLRDGKESYFSIGNSARRLGIP